MATIETINPENFLNRSNARFFQIFLVTDRELLSYTNNGFHNAQVTPMNGFMNMQLFNRDESVRAYYDASRTARDLMDGSLQIVAVPI